MLCFIIIIIIGKNKCLKNNVITGLVSYSNRFWNDNNTEERMNRNITIPILLKVNLLFLFIYIYIFFYFFF